MYVHYLILGCQLTYINEWFIRSVASCVPLSAVVVVGRKGSVTQ